MSTAEKKIVVPIDGSDPALHALRVALKRARESGARIHLINVQLPVNLGSARAFLPKEAIEQYHAEESALALKSARELLSSEGVPFEAVTRTGHPADEIAAYASATNDDEIIMGSRGMGLMGNLVMGSVAAKVVHAAQVPVTLVK